MPTKHTPPNQQNSKHTKHNTTNRQTIFLKPWPGGMRVSDPPPPLGGCPACWIIVPSSCRVLPDPKFPSPKFRALDAWPRILAKPGGVLTPPYLPGGPAYSAGPALSWLLAALVPNFSDFYRIFQRFSRFFRHIFSIDFSHVFFHRFWDRFGLDLGSLFGHIGTVPASHFRALILH